MKEECLGGTTHAGSVPIRKDAEVVGHVSQKSESCLVGVRVNKSAYSARNASCASIRAARRAGT